MWSWKLETWAFGKAAVGFEVVSGAAGRWEVSVVVTESVWEFASGAAVSAGRVGTADRSPAGAGETDGGVNFAASVALEPCAFVGVVPESAGLTGSLHLCNGKGLPQASWQGAEVPGGSVVPLETNLVEPPVWNIVMSTKIILQHKNNALVLLVLIFCYSSLE